MFLFESLRFRSFRTTEPRFFNILRILCAIIFSLLLGFYAWISYVEFISNIYKPTLYTSELFDNDYLGIGIEPFDQRQIFLNSIRKNASYPEFEICPGTLNDNSTVNLNLSFYELYRNSSNSQLFIYPFHNEFLRIDETLLYRERFSEYSVSSKGFTDLTKLQPHNISFLTSLYNDSSNLPRNDIVHDDNNCKIFTPENNLTIGSKFIELGRFDNYVFNSELLFIIASDNYSTYEINFKSVFINEKANSISPNNHFITRGQYVIYEFIIKKRKYYSSYLYGMFGSKATEEAIIIEIEEKVLATIPNASYTVLQLKPKNGFIKYEEEKFQFTVVNLISNLGGFYSAISGIFVLLFGAQRLSPWGVCQTSWLCCWPFRRSFKKNLANRYVSRAGIPLAEDPRNLPPGARIEDRVAVLEHLLKEYYIDPYYLEKLRNTRERYLELKNEFNEFSTLLGDDDDDRKYKQVE